MSKIILSLIIVFTINLGTIKKSEAVIAGVVALAGGAPAVVAYSGLAIATVGTLIGLNQDSVEGIGIIGVSLFVGLILLDEKDNIELELLNLSETSLIKKGLTPPEVIAVLDNQEELEAVFNTSITNDQTNEAAAQRWEVAKEIYGEDAVTGFYKILT